MISDYLKSNNIKVEFTRDSDVDINLTKRVENININYFDFDLCISIHCNSFYNNKLNGIETYYGIKNKELKFKNFLLSFCVQNSVSSKSDYLMDRGINIDHGMYLINNLRIPSCIMEVGFITNINDYNVLTSKIKKRKISELIGEGIIDYLNKIEK